MLDFLGNFTGFDTDLNGDGQCQSSNDRLIAGSFNQVNEITQLTKTESGKLAGEPAVHI